jgi:hypothetical protein
MAEIITLNRFRKAKELAEARTQADANAVKFGRRKGDKALEAAKLKQEKQNLDGHERE